MNEELETYLHNPVIGKFATAFIGICIIWGIVKWLQRSLFSKILKSVEAKKGEFKFDSATFQLVEAPEISVKVKS